MWRQVPERTKNFSRPSSPVDSSQPLFLIWSTQYKIQASLGKTVWEDNSLGTSSYTGRQRLTNYFTHISSKRFSNFLKYIQSIFIICDSLCYKKSSKQLASPVPPLLGRNMLTETQIVHSSVYMCEWPQKPHQILIWGLQINFSK